ncbi:hypothetical protein KEU06_28895 [Pseudaminobacter sp. 19-2017]|uniref:Uncharacterized protein n=1 Tax=Pseudaminobacter soli (ex Zhang et al. 2022) TaxID=2831468 RepID=A0A942E7L1_9HYPH|nr:hypothetical protein [Pseudaminobacter soli]MBS3652598.1 hypothetical protein [Pseudaminobacter soli]
MASFDSEKLVAGMRKLVGEVQRLTQKVEFVEEENGKLRRMHDELTTHLGKIRTSVANMDEMLDAGLKNIGEGLDRILEERTGAIQAESKELRQDVAFLQALVAGHEVVLIEITGDPTTPVFPTDLTKNEADPAAHSEATISPIYGQPRSGTSTEKIGESALSGRS